MTPTKQSPETRARELLERLFEHNGNYQEFCFDHREELTTLITKADALDWLEKNPDNDYIGMSNDYGNKENEWCLFRAGKQVGQSTSLLSAITEAMKGRE